MRVVPQTADASGSDMRLGRGSIDVSASHSGHSYVTSVNRHGAVRLTIGTVLDPGAAILSVTLDGQLVDYGVQLTARGREVVVTEPRGTAAERLVVVTR